jgi:hypothetical protein
LLDETAGLLEQRAPVVDGKISGRNRQLVEVVPDELLGRGRGSHDPMIPRAEHVVEPARPKN